MTENNAFNSELALDSSGSLETAEVVVGKLNICVQLYAW